MARKPKEYTRLPGHNRSAFAISGVARCSLWAAKDHVLYVANEGYSEEYRRFYYRDIQAIIVRKTVTGAVGSAILSIISTGLLLWLLYGVNEDWDIAGLVVLGFTAGLFIIPLLVNMFRGPTCATFMRTAVQTERIHSLNRLRTAMKAVRRLREPIEEVQGQFAAELVPKMEEETARLEEEEARRKAAAAATAKAKAASRPLKPHRGQVHRILFAFLLADFCHNCLQLHFTDPNLFLVDVALGVGVVVTAVIALIRQNRTTLWTGIKVVTWATLPYLVILNILANMFFFVFSMTGRAIGQSTWDMYRTIYATSPHESWLRMAMVVASIVGSGGLGLSGLLMFNRFKRDEARAIAEAEEAAREPEPAAAEQEPTE